MSQRTRPTPKGFKPKTLHEFGANELFDADISGLHKLVRPQKILGKKVRYYQPSIAQVPYMMNFLVEAFSDLIMSPDEINKLDRNELFLKVVNFVVDATKDIDSKDEELSLRGQEVLGYAFGSKAAISYLIPVMRQCFPDIEIYRATNETFIACFNVLFSDMFVTEESESTPS